MSTITLIALIGVPAILVLVTLFSRDELKHIPVIGPSGRLSSYYGAFQYLFNGPSMIQEGYDKYRGGVFRIANFFSWHVFISGDLIEELRRAPDNQLSFSEAVFESLQIEHTLGDNIHHNPYHIPIVRTQLTRNISAIFPEIRDEIIYAFEATIPAKNEWTKVPAYHTVMQTVCMISNRVFVGLPLCRDPDWRKLNTEFTIDVTKVATALHLFPPFLRSFASRLFPGISSSYKRATKHLRPIIEERRKKMAEHGSLEDWADKPKDMLEWLMEEATEEESTPEMLARRMLTINFAAIHTSTMSFTHALYYLATNPEFIIPMREEVDAIIKEDGWTKEAIGKMRLVDSFMRETMRIAGLGATSMTRKVLQPVTFSDGTHLPTGTTVSVTSRAMHLDNRNYAEADVFSPWRFAELRANDGEGTKHQMVSTSLDYTPFGHGRHACPGRFFAANELKAMMAHIVATYDVRLPPEAGGIYPAPLWFNDTLVPNMKAEVEFRKRQA